MIVVTVELYGAISLKKSTLARLVIDNIGGTPSRGDYRVRAYKKSAKTVIEQLKTEKPIREGQVLNHAKLAEPVSNLVAKALAELKYG